MHVLKSKKAFHDGMQTESVGNLQSEVSVRIVVRYTVYAEMYSLPLLPCHISGAREQRCDAEGKCLFPIIHSFLGQSYNM